jgi:uncharacterized membrane protein
MAEDEERTRGTDESSNQADGDRSRGGAESLRSALMSKEVVIPALATAAGVVAYAARKGAADAGGKLEGEAQRLGEQGAEGAKKGLSSGVGSALGSLASKALSRGGGGKAKKTRRLPIQRWTDVAAPVATTYEKWTQFNEFPNFMHRVLNVEQENENKVSWDEKIWFSKRRWEGEITERKKNKRIAWKTTSGMAHAGVVTFHRLDDELTRVMVDMDFVPQGTIEKMASGMRFVKRAVEADLARFKAYVEMGQADELDYHAKPAEREGEKRDDEEKGEARSNGGSERDEAAGEREEDESRQPAAVSS